MHRRPREGTHKNIRRDQEAKDSTHGGSYETANLNSKLLLMQSYHKSSICFIHLRGHALYSWRLLGNSYHAGLSMTQANLNSKRLVLQSHHKSSVFFTHSRWRVLRKSYQPLSQITQANLKSILLVMESHHKGPVCFIHSLNIPVCLRMAGLEKQLAGLTIPQYNLNSKLQVVQSYQKSSICFVHSRGQAFYSWWLLRKSYQASPYLKLT